MLGRKERDQLELFIIRSLRHLVPDDHILARIDRALDLSWLRSEVEGLYCESNGRPGRDPEVAVRLMLAGFLLGIVHDRRLMREAQVNIAIRWFVGFGLHEALPNHSSLTHIRQRWGAERFRRIFRHGASRTASGCRHPDFKPVPRQLPRGALPEPGAIRFRPRSYRRPHSPGTRTRARRAPGGAVHAQDMTAPHASGSSPSRRP